MKCRKLYKDGEKYRKYRNGCNSRYYKKTEDASNKGVRWTDKDMKMILEKKYSDTELSDLLGRSVKAIQIKRHKLTKMA